MAAVEREERQQVEQGEDEADLPSRSSSTQMLLADELAAGVDDADERHGPVRGPGCDLAFGAAEVKPCDADVLTPDGESRSPSDVGDSR